MKNEEERCFINFNLISDKTEKALSMAQRDLSLKGRVLLTKAEGLSRLTYADISLFVNKKLSNITFNI